MALDISKLLGEATLTTLPATLVFNYPTIEALAEFLGEKVLPVPIRDAVPAKTESADEEWTALTEQIDGLSRSEVEARLEEELAGLDDLVGRHLG
jgi:polyketide synthase 12/myxalamid-type polyketide synthase MxaB